MLKLLGSACVLGGGVLAVVRKLAERRRQRQTLADLTTALRHMAEEIRLMRTPLPRLLEGSAQGLSEDAAAFFLAVSDGLRQGESAAESWCRAAAVLPLAERDRAAISAVGKCLQGDEESACKGISLAIYELAKSAEEWEKLRPEEAKRTAALYLSAAALLVILLI